VHHVAREEATWTSRAAKRPPRGGAAHRLSTTCYVHQDTVLTQLVAELEGLRASAQLPPGPVALLRAVLFTDSFTLVALQRARELAMRRRIPLGNSVLRRLQQLVGGIELGSNITLGEGVFFVHPVGVVIGGDARIGNRVRFYGSNTVGTAHDDGYPTIEDDVWVGAGARILGPITVGARSRIGANAVVVTDIPPDSIAVGIPATFRPITTERKSPSLPTPAPLHNGVHARATAP
jgi:serine O-acetyltransferase